MKKRYIFENTNNQYQKTWLPQVSVDPSHVTNELSNENVKFIVTKEDPNDLHPLQTSVNLESVEYFNNKIKNKEEIEPIFLSRNNEVLDGHHRLFAYKSNPNVKKVVCIKIMLDYKDAARFLNRIQDRFNWEKEQENNENPTLDTNIPSQEVNSQNSVEEQPPIDENNNDTKKTLDLYRSKPIENKAKTGNYFTLENKKGFNHMYTLEFDNLYEISDDELQTNDPIQCLAEKWFGSDDINNLKEEAAKNALTYEIHLIRKIREEAIKRGYDGIKYGSKFVQTI